VGVAVANGFAVIRNQAVETGWACTAGVPQPAERSGMNKTTHQIYLRTKKPAGVLGKPDIMIKLAVRIHAP
jgi:hypothetical protein